jgi:L-lactate dehydrogenase complex protein LldG
MSDFAAALSAMRVALQQAASSLNDHSAIRPESAPAPQISAPACEELTTQFARELEALGGKALVADSTREAFDAVVELARTLGFKLVAVGDSATINLKPLGEALSHNGVALLNTARVAEDDRRQVRARLAECDAGIVEADYAVASSGTLVFVPTPARPRSLSLVPPTNVTFLRVERILPDLAALMSTLESSVVADNPIAFVTGPSRTADIEKRLVKGVHGPKALYVILVSSTDG